MNTRNTLIGLGVLLLVAVVGVWAFTGRDMQLSAVWPDMTTPPAVETLEEVTDDPELYVGEQVTVRGEVDTVLGNNTIVLDVPGELVNDEILVVSTNPVAETVVDTQGLLDQRQVRLSGTVTQFVYTEVYDTLDPNVTADVVATFEGRPFILTDNIVVIEPGN